MNKISRQNLSTSILFAPRKLLLLVIPFLAILTLLPSKPASATNSLAVLGPDFTPAPSWVKVQGAAPSSETMQISLILKTNPALQSYASEVNTPGNPNYHRYLTHQEIGQKFGQAQSTINAIDAYFTSKGLTTRAGVGRMSIKLSGPASSVESAFGTLVQMVSIPGIGMRPEATRVPSLPQSFANDIQSIVGLSDYLKFKPGLITRPKLSPTTSGASLVPATTPSSPVSTCQSARLGVSMEGWSPNSPSVLGYDYQMDPFYSTGYFGQGQTVAFLEFATYNPSDITNFENCFGSSATLMSPVLVDGGASSTNSGHSEATGDLETVASLAPDASLEVYSAPNSSTGFLDAVSQWVSQDNAAIMSNSWDLCEAGKSALAQSLNTYFAAAAIQGQTFVSASGDSGSQCSGSLSVTIPADSPNVLAVGGTSLPGYFGPGETTWNSPSGASGGGVSTAFTLPGYQSALGALSTPASTDYSTNCPTSSYPNGCRMVPDVSASADPAYGYYTYCTSCTSISNWSEIGGTSMSTPLWAAGLSLINQACYSTKGNLGLANSVLYPMAGTAAFNDITAGNNDVSALTGYNTPYYSAAPGYDMVTGLGTPNFATIAEQYCSPAFAPTLALSSTSSTFQQTSPGGSTLEQFTLKNVGFSSIAEPGLTAISISGIDPGQFGIVSSSSTCSTANTLVPGGTCAIAVSYNPTYYGTAEATLSVASSSSNSPAISLVGDTPTLQLTSPNNSISITAYLGSQTTASTSLSLTNSTSYPLQLGNPSFLITGTNPSAFGVGSSSTCSGTIAASTTCSLEIVYATQASPTADSAQLSLIDGLGDSYATLSLVGTTKYPYLTIASGTFSPSGSVTVGGSASSTITVTANGGSIALSSPPISLTAVVGSSDYGYSITSDSCEASGVPLTLTDGQSCSVGVLFAPGAAGTFNADLSANTASPLSPAATSLDETAVVPTGSTGSLLSVNPTTLDFGQVAIGSSQSETLTISAEYAALVLDQGYLSSLPMGYSISPNGTTCSNNLLIPANGSCVVDIVFSPANTTTVDGTSTISTQPTQSPAVVVQLSGNGYTPTPVPSPAPAPAPAPTTTTTTSSTTTTTLTTTPTPVPAPAPTPIGEILASPTGQVTAIGGATNYGSVTARLNKPIVNAALTPDGKGYWLVASDGGVFSFGDANFYGSTGAMVLNKPIVNMAPTPDGKGYWLVASDGGVFSFGDANFYGSTGNLQLSSPALAIKASPDGKGYTIYTADGQFFNFGDASTS